jgi:hypothetical protein
VTKVKELLVPEGGEWSKEKLNNCFFETDVADIMKIPIGRAGSDDYIAWNYTKNGIFSVRSAYHLNSRLNETLRWGRGPLRTLQNIRVGSLFGRPTFRGRSRSTVGGWLERV